MKNFALIGAAGYIAPRHLKAIKDTNNNLVCACDPFDSVGILDRYFNDVAYFKEFERFDRHIEKLHYTKTEPKIDFVSVCSPNHLHDAHIRFGLRVGANVICEKPVVVNPWNIDHLKEIEENCQGRVNTVLQLRVHPSIIALREKILNSPSDKVFDVDLTYLTSRGPWYHYSWKGDESKSGGFATNIGVHFFDMLNWIFGDIEHSEVHARDKDVVAGHLKFAKANVRWILSINRELLPANTVEQGQTTYRSILIDGEELEFSGGFTDLHTKVYEDILNGNGFGLDAARTAIEIVHGIRAAETGKGKCASHPLLNK